MGADAFSAPQRRHSSASAHSAENERQAHRGALCVRRIAATKETLSGAYRHRSRYGPPEMETTITRRQRAGSPPFGATQQLLAADSAAPVAQSMAAQSVDEWVQRRVRSARRFAPFILRPLWQRAPEKRAKTNNTPYPPATSLFPGAADRRRRRRRMKRLGSHLSCLSTGRSRLRKDTARQCTYRQILRYPQLMRMYSLDLPRCYCCLLSVPFVHL